MITSNLIDITSVTPPLYDIIVLIGEIHILIGPIDRLLRLGYLLPPHLLLPLPENHRQLLRISNVVFSHILTDLLVIVPAVIVYLISTKVCIIIAECFIHVRIHVFEDLPSQRYSGVELPFTSVITEKCYLFIFLASPPRLRMRRRVDLGDDADAPSLRVSY